MRTMILRTLAIPIAATLLMVYAIIGFNVWWSVRAFVTIKRPLERLTNFIGFGWWI